MSFAFSPSSPAPTIGALTARVLKHAASARAYPRAPARSGAQHRTGAPVLRDSKEAGTFEESFFSVPAKGETDHLLRMARKALDAARHLRRKARQGDKLSVVERVAATLTPAAVRAYEEILTLARLNQGRVFPSYEHLAQATGLGRGTIGRVLNILEKVGFLVRQRRFKRVEDADLGRRYEQTSNVYRATAAQRILALLPRWMRPAPPPEDAVQREVDRQEDCQRMYDQLTCREYAQATVPDGPMMQALASLGGRIDALGCES